MRKALSVGIGIFVVIVAAYGVTQSQDMRSITDDDSGTTIADESQTSNMMSDQSENTSSIMSDMSKNSSQDCRGTAKCVSGTVTKIIDGDTIHVDEVSVRFALVLAPNLEGYGGKDARDFIQTVCPIGSKVLVDEDDGHVLGEDFRIVGLVTCNDVILNQEVLDANLGNLEVRFCSASEFVNDGWAIKHGCVKE